MIKKSKTRLKLQTSSNRSNIRHVIFFDIFIGEVQGR